MAPCTVLGRSHRSLSSRVPSSLSTRWTRIAFSFDTGMHGRILVDPAPDDAGAQRLLTELEAAGPRDSRRSAPARARGCFIVYGLL
jgi:hypothetical protein